jgi:hypothetical protein
MLASVNQDVPGSAINSCLQELLLRRQCQVPGHKWCHIHRDGTHRRLTHAILSLWAQSIVSIPKLLILLFSAKCFLDYLGS